MKKLTLTTQEADNILFTMMQATLSEEQHRERMKIKVNDLNSFHEVVELFMFSDVDNIMLETNYKIFKQYIELVQSESGPFIGKNMKVTLNVADRIGNKILINIYKEIKP